MENQVREMRKESLRELAKAHYEKATEFAKAQLKRFPTIKDTQVDITPQSIGWGDSNQNEWRGTIQILDSEGKRVFGADIDIYINQEKYSKHTNHIEVNVGSIGTYNRVDGWAQVQKAKILVELLDSTNEEWLLKELGNYDMTALHQAVKELREIERQEEKEAKEQRDAEYQALKDSIKQGNVYELTHNGYTTQVEIKSVSTQTVTLKEATRLTRSDNYKARYSIDEITQHIKSGWLKAVA